MLFNALIVDDEKLARERLRSLLSEYTTILTIAGEAPDGEAAMQFIEKNPVDVVFLDIQMPGISGIDLARKLPENIYVIFTTAYDQYAIKAFESNTIDYLLKPIETPRLNKAVDKLKRLAIEGFANHYQQMQSFLLAMERKSSAKFTVKIGDKVIFLDYSDIIFFKAEEKYITVKTYDREYIVSDTIAALEDRLSGDIFCRCHRSSIVNLNHVKEARKWFAGRYQLVMKDKEGTLLPLSRNLKNRFGL